MAEAAAKKAAAPKTESKPTVDRDAVHQAQHDAGERNEAERQARIAARNRGLTPQQYDILLRPLNATRIANRQQGGKTLSYLESWEVKAHLTRVFGFGNWDAEVVDYGYVATREYEANNDKKTPMVEVIYRARIQLTIRDSFGNQLCRHSEVAVGSTSGPANMLGEHHDNAVKTAASDALKRCAINLGTQFGLSLYDNGSKADVVKQTLAPPVGWKKPEPAADDPMAKAKADLEARLGATEVKEPTS